MCNKKSHTKDKAEKTMLKTCENCSQYKFDRTGINLEASIKPEIMAIHSKRFVLPHEQMYWINLLENLEAAGYNCADKRRDLPQWNHDESGKPTYQTNL